MISDAGTPSISDPGAILVNECVIKEIDIFPIPGASAVSSADETADAPGIGKISISLITHSLTNIAPGSEIDGVPASEIIETTDPDFKISITFDKFFFSLNLWFTISFDLISYRSNKFFEIRVSSHST